MILEDATNGLSDRVRRIIAELYDLMTSLDSRIAFFDKEIQAVFRQSEDCQRIAKIKGVGPKTATAVVAAIADGKEFKNGRHFASWLGLVPRQYSSGDRQVMMNITKHGDQHLRTLLVHGARAVVRTAVNKHDCFNQWVIQLKERRGSTKQRWRSQTKMRASFGRYYVRGRNTGVLEPEKFKQIADRLINGIWSNQRKRNLIFILAL